MKANSTTHNSTYKKLAVLCHAETLVVNENLVLRNNIRAERCQLLVAAERYTKPLPNGAPKTDSGNGYRRTNTNKTKRFSSCERARLESNTCLLREINS